MIFASLVGSIFNFLISLTTVTFNLKQSRRINSIHRLIPYVRIHVPLAIAETSRILRRPSSRMSIIIPRAEAEQLRVLIVHSRAETERYESRIRVLQYITIFVVVDTLDNLARGGVYDKTRTAQMIGDDAIGLATLDDIRRGAVLVSIDEPGDHIARAVQLGHRVDIVHVDEALDQDAVHLLADPPPG